MARLTSMPSRLASAPARLSSIGSGPDRLKRRDQNVEWRKWYKTARWRKLRSKILERDRFTCCRCNRPQLLSRNLVADHRLPHRGGEDLFWDEGNLQCMCKECHDRHKQREERANAHSYD